MEMEGGAVLGVVACGGAVRALAGSHEGRVDRQEEVAAGARRKVVRELHAHRTVHLGDDRRSQVLGIIGRVDLRPFASRMGPPVGYVSAMCLPGTAAVDT